MSPASLPVDVPSRWDAIFDSSARDALERALPEYIAQRRWYRTKTKPIEAARVVAAFPLRYACAGAEAASRVERVARIGLVEVSFEGGARDTYVVPLAFVLGDTAAELEARFPHALVLPVRIVGGVAPVHEATATGFIVDAMVLGDVTAALLETIRRGGVVEDAGRALAFHPLPLANAATGSLLPRLVDADQTNTSVLYGDTFVGKVLRRLEPGESPDLEVVRFLEDAGYIHVPPLAGWVDVRDGAEARPSTVALLQAFVPNRGDAWRHVGSMLDRWLARASEHDAPPPTLEGDLLERASSPVAPEVAALVADDGAFAELLGRRVGEMHVELASRPDLEAFRPEPLDVAARRRIASSARADLERALSLLVARAPGLPEATRAAIRELCARRSLIDARLDEATRAAEGAVRIRVHGDLHLGQVLFTGSDFVLIDFEGEPARPVEERRSKRSPFVDVAGMLRSFHYAAVAALRAQPEPSRVRLAPWTALWHRAVASSFLRGWLHAVRGSTSAPRDPEATRALLDLFVFEKAVYELGYELDNRPGWIDIPLAGLLDATAPREPANGSDRLE